MKLSVKALAPAISALVLSVAAAPAVAGPVPDVRCALDAFQQGRGPFGAINWYKDLQANAARGNAAAVERLKSYNACTASQPKPKRRG